MEQLFLNVMEQATKDKHTMSKLLSKHLSHSSTRRALHYLVKTNPDDIVYTVTDYKYPFIVGSFENKHINYRYYISMLRNNLEMYKHIKIKGEERHVFKRYN